jgi:hypothetical protein
MDLLTLANTVYSLAKPILTSEVGRKITEDFKGAFSGTAVELWEKISPIFIEVVEEKENSTQPVTDLRNKTDVEMAEEIIIGDIKSALYKDKTLKAAIEAILEKAKEDGDEETKAIIIKNSEKFIVGGVSGGTVVFGDYHGEKKD